MAQKQQVIPAQQQTPGVQDTPTKNLVRRISVGKDLQGAWANSSSPATRKQLVKRMARNNKRIAKSF